MEIKIENLTKAYGDFKAVDNMNLNIADGELVGLLGPSGCGKSTTLFMLAGLNDPTSGHIYFGGKDVTKVAPEDREIGLVFQNYALYPHMTVADNIMFPLINRKVPKAEARERAQEMAKLVQLDHLMDRKPKALSGGQQQRVAIARALANKPHVLLLDEPLGALDLKLRKDMQKELKAIQKRLGITFIYVTHDQEEALSMSDRVVVMDKGKIQQIGTPEDIYNEPVNAFVADFIGESNIVDAVMIKDYLVSFAGVTFECLDSGFEPNEVTEAVIRPEDITFCEIGKKDSLTGVVTDVVFKGTFYETFVDVNGFIWLVQTTEYHKVGEKVAMYIDADSIHVMKRSEYSGEYGDYSNFSDEFDHINDADYDWEAENDK